MEFAIQCVKERRRVVAVDLGCGSGIQSARLALLGIETFAYDLMPDSGALQAIKNAAQAMQDDYPMFRLNTKEVDIRRLEKEDFPENISIAYTQRFIHYLNYGQAKLALSILYDHMVSGGKLFISASGLESEVGRYHPSKSKPIRERYERLPREISERHEIYEPICPWAVQELESTLKEIGFCCSKITESDFGNVKGIFFK
jgi:SAM-dependent methyltransferase